MPTTVSPSCWSTAMVPVIDLYHVQTIPGYRNADVLSVGLTPQRPLPKPGSCRKSLFRHHGFGSGRGSSKQWDLPSAIMVQVPSLTLSLASDFSAGTLPSCSPPITRCSHFCCMPVISFCIVVKIKNRLIETHLNFLCEVFWDMSHHPNKVYQARAPWWPGIYPSAT